MFQAIDRPDRRAIITPVARLDFILAGDRWTHRLAPASAGEDGPPVIASSVEAPESAGPRADPPSPTYQEVTLVVTPDSAQVFCLGSFGPSHYATAITVRHLDSTPGSEGDGVPTTVFEVDVAVRRDAADRPLAATYTVHWPPSALSWASPTGACWELVDPPLLAVLEQKPGPPDTPRLQVDEAGRAACRAQLVAAGAPGDRTNRLRYDWLISDRQGRPR